MINKVHTRHELAIPISIVNFVIRAALEEIDFPRCLCIEMQFFCQIIDLDNDGVTY